MDANPFGVRCVFKGYDEKCAVWYAFLEDQDESRGEDDVCGGQLADDGLDVIRRIAIASSTLHTQELYPGLRFSPGVSLKASKNRRLFTSSQPSFAPVLSATVHERDGHFLAHAARLTLRRVIRACSRIFVSKALATACGGYAGSVDLQLRFMCYQIFRACDAAHSGNRFFASLTSNSILVSDRLWLEVLPIFSSSPSKEPDSDVPYLTRWIEGRLSNFEYLVLLNGAAGRGPGISSNHAVMPWVSDFTEFEGGWRDLTKTKFRLTKGDAMLDRSYAASRHHVAEPALSELALCIYFARRAPISTLRRVVRANFVAEQYPASMRRLYSWSPDECVPEFFCDPTIFKSLHEDRGLQDLAVPRWCDGDASKFVDYHRRLLESDQVSDNLHRWIDLIFGYASKGSKAAQDNKNVPLDDANVPGIYDKLIPSGGVHGSSSTRVPPNPSSTVANTGGAGSSGASRPSLSSYSSTVAKLFDSPHPRRRKRREAPLTDENASPSPFFAAPSVDQDQKRRSLEAYLMLQPLSSRGVDPPLPPPDPERQRARGDFDRAAAEAATASKLRRLLKSDSMFTADPKRRDARAVGIIVSEIYEACSVGPIPPPVRRTVEALLKGDASILAAEIAQKKRKSRTSPRLSYESAAPPPPRTDDSYPSGTLGCWREEKQQRGQAVLLDDIENRPRSPRYGKTVTSSSSSSQKNSLFPDYFQATYAAIGALRQARTRRDRVQVLLLQCLNACNDLPFAGVLLALPHILETLDNPMDWVSNGDDIDANLLNDDEDLQDDEEYEEEDEGDEADVPARHERPSVAAELTLLVHTLGNKLGVALSASALLPRVVRVIDTFLLASRETNEEEDKAVEKRRELFFHSESKRRSTSFKLSVGSSDGDELWRVIILRCGAAAFARLLLPTLVDVALVVTPEDSATTVVRLMRDDALGAALATRFLLPVAIAGLGKINGGGNVATQTKQLALSESLVAPSGKAAAVIAICRVVGVEAIAPFILPSVLSSLAQLEGALSEPIPTKSARLALLEVVCVLRRLVDSLSANTVLYYYVRLAAQNNNPLPRLLGALLPSTAALRDEDALADSTLALNEVAALVSLVCMHVGEDVTVKSLLPDIDKFFAQLVHLYRSADEGTPNQGRDAARRLALDVARELYTPLAAMLSFDVMRRHAPSARFLVEFAGQQANTHDIGVNSSPAVVANHFDESKPQQRATDVLYHSSRRAIDWGHDAIDWFMRPSPANNYAPQRAGSHQTQHTTVARRDEDHQRVAINRSPSVPSSHGEQRPPGTPSAGTAPALSEAVHSSQRRVHRTNSADGDEPIVARQTTARQLASSARVRSESARPAATTTTAKSTFHEGDGMELHQLRDARYDAVLPTRLKTARGRHRKASWRTARAALTTASGEDASTAQRHDVELFGVNEDVATEEADEVEDEFDMTDDEDEEEEIMPIHDEDLVLEDEEDEDDARRRREALEDDDDDDDDAPTPMTPVAAGKAGNHSTPARASSRRGGQSRTPPPPPSARRLASMASPMVGRSKDDDGSAGNTAAATVAAAAAASTPAKRSDEDEALFQDQDRLWLLGGFLSASGATSYQKSTSGVVDRPWEQIDAPWAPRMCVSSRPLQLSALPPNEMTTPILAQRRRRGASCVVAVDAAESLALVGGRDGAVRIWSLRERPRPDARPWAAKADRHMRRIRTLFCLDGDGAMSAVSSDGARFDYWDVETGTAIRRWVWTTAAGVSSSASWRGSNIERLVDLAPIPVGYAAGGALFSGHGSHCQQILALSERAVSLVDLRAPRSSGVTQFDISFNASSFEQHSFLDEQGGSTSDSASSAIFGAPCGESGQISHPYTATPPPNSDEFVGGSGVVHAAVATTSTQATATKVAAANQRDGIPTAIVKEDYESYSGARCVTSSPNGRWIAIGSDSGRIAVLERHAGRVLASWAAHGPGVAVVKLVAFHGNELLSVGADRIVTLWKVSSCVPHALAYARLDFRGPVQPHAVQATRFDDGTTLVIAASGHKMAVARLGRPKTPLTRQKLSQANLLFSQPTAQVAVRRASGPIQAHRQYLQDERSQRIHRHHFLIE